MELVERYVGGHDADELLGAGELELSLPIREERAHELTLRVRFLGGTDSLRMGSPPRPRGQGGAEPSESLGKKPAAPRIAPQGRC